MLAIFISWFISFLVLFPFGFGFIRLIQVLSKQSNPNYSIDVYFFTGFSVMLIITSFLSVFIPLNNKVLIVFIVLSVVIIILNFNNLKKYLSSEYLKDRNFIIFITILVLFLLSALAHDISVGDTALYHTQSIKWIKEYPVVPGLANIHGRFGFNSMFFVISGLFSFEIHDTVIYPLNALSLFVVFIRIFLSVNRTIDIKGFWNIVLYLILVLLLFNWLLSSLNSPAPDVILTTLLVYIFLLFHDTSFNMKNMKFIHILLVNLLVFTCIVIKLSSLFCVLALIPLWRTESIKRIGLSFTLGILIIVPFLIRNYYLSGYLIYPFPAIDIFTVDWKVPLEKVINEKQWIESWAKIPGLPPSEVLPLSIREWFVPWVKAQNDSMLIIIGINLLSIMASILMIIKKELKYLWIIGILFINFSFWFMNAPDPRFVYGLLFIGAAFTIGYFLKIINWQFLGKIYTYKKQLTLLLLVILMVKFWYYPVHTLRHPKLWILPTAIEKPPIEIIEGDFTYIHTLADNKCYNAELPCVPYILKNVVLRGEGIGDGFKIVKEEENDYK